MAYAAGAGGATASTIFPCGHMGYYDSGNSPPVVCPICGTRHQNAHLFAPMVVGQPITQTYTASSTNVNMAQVSVNMINNGESERDEFSPLNWLDRELARVLKR